MQKKIDVYIDLLIQMMIFNQYADSSNDIFDEILNKLIDVFNEGNLKQKYHHSIKFNDGKSLSVIFDKIDKAGEIALLIQMESEDDQQKMITKIAEFPCG